MRPADEGRRHAGLTDRRLEPCPRHMRPVASAAWEAMVRDPGTAVQTVDLATYRALLADPTWGLVRQLLVTTRWYDKGMELALAWLAVTDRYEAVLPAPEVATGRAQLYGLLLDMLDRLDAWETYLEVWSQLRRHTAYSLAYGDGPHSAATRPQAQPYVVRREPGEIQLHFLWLSSYRKDLIERKLAAKRAGRRLGHLRHHPPDELSDAEVRRRVSAVARWARTLRREGTDSPDPDAPHGAATPPAPADLVPRSLRSR